MRSEPAHAGKIFFFTLTNLNTFNLPWQKELAKGNEALFSKQIKRAFFGYSDAFNVITFLRDYLHDIYGHRLLGIHKYAKKNI